MPIPHLPPRARVVLLGLVATFAAMATASDRTEKAVTRNYVMAPATPAHQTVDEAEAKSKGCVTSAPTTRRCTRTPAA